MSLIKYCLTCKADLPIVKFAKSKKNAEGRLHICKNCIKSTKEKLKIKYSDFDDWKRKCALEKKRKTLYAKDRKYKECSCCGIAYPKTSEFFSVSNNKCTYICKSCTSKKSLKLLKENENTKKRQYLRNRVTLAFRVHSKSGKLYSSMKYGIDYGAIINYLGDCPGNRSEWHVDHIIPLCAFNLDNPEQVRLAFLPENHRWCTKKENLTKNGKYNKKDYESYIDKYSA